LTRIRAHGPKQWKRVPFVGTDELYQMARKEFDDLPIAHGRESREWMASLKPGDPKFAWVQRRRAKLRAERANDKRYTDTQYGLIADDDLVAAFPEIVVYESDGDDTSPIAGYNVNAYIAMLHAAIIELSDKVDELSTGTVILPS